MLVRRSSHVLSSVAVLVWLLPAQSLTPLEEKIVASVNADKQNSEELLEQMVNINSGTLNPAGVHNMADLLKPKFESLGFTCRFIPQEEVGRAGHMSCQRKGESGKRVLLTLYSEADPRLEESYIGNETAIFEEAFSMPLTVRVDQTRIDDVEGQNRLDATPNFQ